MQLLLSSTTNLILIPRRTPIYIAPPLNKYSAKMEETIYKKEPFIHPFTCIIAGPSGSGKTQLLLNILSKPSEFIDPPPERIVYCYTSWQEKFNPFKNEIEFVQGIPDMEDLLTNPHERKLIVFDDLMEETSNNVNVQHMFTRGSHHHNLSIFLLTQNLFGKGKFARTINLNSQYTIVFDNPRDRTQIRYLAREIFPDKTKFLIEAYTDAIKTPHGYIFIDNKQGTPLEIRIQTRINEPIRTVYKLKNIY